MFNSEVENTREEIERLEKLIELADGIERLSENKDFKKVILDEFLVTHCAQNVQNSVNMRLSAEQRADCLAMAQAAGFFKQFMMTTLAMADHARKELGEHKDMLQQLSHEAGE